MHGLGDDPGRNAKKLRRLGFSAVVGNTENIGAALENGLDCYLCAGAYGYSGEFKNENYLSIDVNGDRRLWFGSTCPTNFGVREKNIETIKSMARTPGIKGVLIDGARFSSPASADNIESFFTCFCGGCMKKADSMGYDALRMRESARELYLLIKGAGRPAGFIENRLPGLIDWFSFRRRATEEHLTDFAETIKTANAELKAGIYIFTPSLSFLVGQNYSGLANVLDFFSPMIYRKYNAPEGPACLNHEMAAIFSSVNGIFSDERRTESFLSSLFGFSVTPRALADGFPPGVIYSEIKKAISLAGGKKVAPIIQLDDEFLDESIAACENAGADTVNFFLYDDKKIDDAIKKGIFINN